MGNKLKNGDKVRYIGGTPELVGLEGVLTDAGKHVAVVVVTKSNHRYAEGQAYYPDMSNLELVEPTLPFSDGGAPQFSKGGLTTEAVEHPAHYGGDTTYEVIKVAEAWGLDSDAYLFNVIKYVGRAGKKAKATLLEDLKKARFYLDRRIKALEDEVSA